jgi:hypothetical protein
MQNQFGGSVGGPIVRDRVFFFADYQGTRQKQGVDTGLIPIPSAPDRTGNLSDSASSFITVDASGNPVPTTVTGSNWAALLSERLGYAVAAGERNFVAADRKNREAVSAKRVGAHNLLDTGIDFERADHCFDDNGAARIPDGSGDASANARPEQAAEKKNQTE